MAKFKNVYQFKITLKYSKPSIWRRIQVPETYNFWELHAAIQDAMGWEDCHLHQFSIPTPVKNVVTYIVHPEAVSGINGKRVKIANYFNENNKTAVYWYDFGDDWYHNLRLEKILPADPNIDYPVCLAGKLACPPEDCGGIGRYYAMLEALSDPKNPAHEDCLDWIGESFDPDHFDPEEVQFLDPKDHEISIFF